jgi:hypothetical protein
MVNQMIFARVLGCLALVGAALIMVGPIHALPVWTIGIVSGICGGMIALWIQAEWRNSQEDHDNES